jgi:hypothetical protein
MQVVQGIGPAVLVVVAVDHAAAALDGRGARERDGLVRRGPRSMKGEEKVKGRLAACKQHNRNNAGSTKAMYRHRTPLKESAQTSTLRADNKPLVATIWGNLFLSPHDSGESAGCLHEAGGRTDSPIRLPPVRRSAPLNRIGRIACISD